MTGDLCINGERLMASLYELGKIGALPQGGVCRLALSEEDRQGRDWVVARMRALGLDITVDAIGNTVGVYPGLTDGPAVMMGSHIDTVATGGLYDGNYGVLSGLEVIATLKDAGLHLRRPIAAAFFTNEEGSRFQPDMMGSLVYQGGLALETALATRGIDGVAVGDALRQIGYDGPAPVGNNRVDSYFELHIEQGPVLDEEGLAIGVVEGVQGISWSEFQLQGVANHAGTTPMRLRRDAGYVAARIGVFARQLAQELGGDQVATVGHAVFSPNLVNVIPDTVTLTVDLRNTDAEALYQAEQRLWAFAAQAAEEEGVALLRKTLARFEPTPFAPEMVALVAAQARERGLPSRRMPSGAGHDAQIMAAMCPAGMIFVPSRAGLSHNTQEFTAPQDLIAGANVLLGAVIQRADRA
ncbi:MULTISPECIES: Zn-dependent hydrolase [Brenneria]|uniref:Zn-dependent hydrolase n=1 Tax=Brenneria nigrifluens DSM 30175 = ATCC 13028 TaxID=1121120 RepID=A0A2U1ULP7_9GAMM|nr:MULTISPECIES: Zn-dependent hydrolase [Brenneria]EHD23834.1 amidase, hydantoinase/carbamoylase family [Brenneria sp. EniD312]PWC22605.1 Zn-dependent hydrolase [Brenneria nigrifluens] [Brenneria nigrifluens DSM 30175 = ATCC 13028]QCR06743.1 Zn-dependent hydrolase [Brenneria nigrifluens] [Brenneria nigrifluens DSM 30175 = ATCC 13028]